MTDKEPEVRSEAVNGVPKLAENATSDLIVKKILPTLKLTMVSEQSQHVVGSMACAVCKLGEQISQQDAAQYLIPLVSILLKNKTTEVIVSLVDNLEPLFKNIGETLLIEKLIPAIINLASDKTWRIRLAVLNFIPKMASFVSQETF